MLENKMILDGYYEEYNEIKTDEYYNELEDYRSE